MTISLWILLAFGLLLMVVALRWLFPNTGAGCQGEVDCDLGQTKR